MYEMAVTSYGLKFIQSSRELVIDATSYWMDINHDPRLKIDKNNLVTNPQDMLQYWSRADDHLKEMIVWTYLLDDPDSVKDDFLRSLKP